MVSDSFLLSKIQSIILEYNYLLTVQLEEQRSVFDKKLAAIEEGYE